MCYGTFLTYEVFVGAMNFSLVHRNHTCATSFIETCNISISYIKTKHEWRNLSLWLDASSEVASLNG